MSLPYAKAIVNPVAGGYLVYRQWQRILKQLRNTGLSFDYEFTQGGGHAIELARRAAEIGYQCIVVVGGDGTVNEVANGILCSTRSQKPTLGIVSAGSACSFARSLGIAQDYIGSCSLLSGQGRSLIDAGVVQYHHRGQLQQHFFVNVADVGFGSEIVNSWNRLPNRFGRRVNHTLRAIEGLRCLSTHRNKTIKLRLGNEVETICSCDVIVANGKFFAGGMKVAPLARLDDGLFNVITVENVDKYELLKIWPKLYSGNHIGHPKIRERKAKTITIESDDPLLVEADGIILGNTPATFSMSPSALTIIGIAQ